MNNRLSLWISGVALLSASTILLALIHLKIPFPPLPFLTFRFDEIPCVIAFLIFGFKAGLTVAFIEFLILNLGKPYHVLIGPLMKFLAIVSMLIGFVVADKLWKLKFKEFKRFGITVFLFMGMIFRVSVMAFSTFILYYILFPKLYLPFAKGLLSRVMGLSFSSDLELVSILLLFTSLFNALHVFFSLIPATIVHKIYVRSLRKSSVQPKVGGSKES